MQIQVNPPCCVFLTCRKKTILFNVHGLILFRALCRFENKETWLLELAAWVARTWCMSLQFRSPAIQHLYGALPSLGAMPTRVTFASDVYSFFATWAVLSCTYRLFTSYVEKSFHFLSTNLSKVTSIPSWSQ
jgi:hypothetical protein